MHVFGALLHHKLGSHELKGGELCVEVGMAGRGERGKNKKQRAESREQRAESRGQTAEGRQQRAHHGLKRVREVVHDDTDLVCDRSHHTGVRLPATLPRGSKRCLVLVRDDLFLDLCVRVCEFMCV
jgi:hypothetical protein